MKGNWVKLHRKLLANSIMSHDGLTRLWLYCLLKANWKERKWLIPGTTEEVTISRGSFVTGRTKLHQSLYGPKFKGDKSSIPSDRTLWRWLKSLEKMGCVRVQNVSNRFSMVSVCKYSTYQKLDEPRCPTSVQPVSNACPTDVQPVSTREEGIKEGNKKEEELNTHTPNGGLFGDAETDSTKPAKKPRKITDYEAAFEEFWACYPNRPGKPLHGKPATYKRWKSFALEERPELITAAKNYAKRCGDYARDPERFLKEDFWRSYLTLPELTPAGFNGNRTSRNGTGQLYRPPQNRGSHG